MKSEQPTINSLLNKWKYFLLIVLCVSAILGFIFSGPYFIKPLYKSSAVLYPVNITSYSDESPTEQLVQLLLSRELQKDVVMNLNLIKYYDIDSTNMLAVDKAIQMFEKRVSIRRTQYESVEIEVKDHDPVFAFSMLNSILLSYNKFAMSLVKRRTNEILIIKRDLFLTKQAQMDSLKNLINKIVIDNNLIEYNLIKEGMKGNIQTLFKNSNMADLKRTLTGTSVDLYYLETTLEADMEYLAELKNDYITAISDVNKQLEFANIISYPEISKKQVYPIRWLICVISAAAALFFSFTLIVLFERRNQ